MEGGTQEKTEEKCRNGGRISPGLCVAAHKSVGGRKPLSYKELNIAARMESKSMDKNL